MGTVVATGVFDILHPGHIFFLEEAKKLGDELIVVVARDKTVKRRKNNPVIPEKQRLEVVKALKPVDKALLGDEGDLFKPIQEINPDIIALGRDQHFDEEWLVKELRKRGLRAKVVRLEGYLNGGLSGSRKIIDKIRKC
ncbi:MAG: adenylyltransferase/cytidyltransferase family protein [Candidatus Altiarchaeota archaeon]|nr:adenylyltransferase/cytidyltransferase family protein [Candidatus Altiarchaeota archaeon]